MLAVGSATGADPGTDDDLDGLTNLWEYDNGLNPGIGQPGCDGAGFSSDGNVDLHDFGILSGQFGGT